MLRGALVAARRLTIVLKNGYIRGLLKMDQAWFDLNEAQSKVVKVIKTLSRGKDSIIPSCLLELLLTFRC